MDIQTITVKAYQFTLSPDEARAAIADPSLIVDRLKAALNGAFEGGGSSVTIEPKRKAARHPKGNRVSGPEALRKIPCPACSKLIASKYLPNHLRKTHPDFKQAS